MTQATYFEVPHQAATSGRRHLCWLTWSATKVAGRAQSTRFFCRTAEVVNGTELIALSVPKILFRFEDKFWHEPLA